VSLTAAIAAIIEDIGRSLALDELAPTVRYADGMTDSADPFLRSSLLIEEAAQALGVSRRTIYYRIQDGRLDTIRTRCGSQRVLRASLEKLRMEVQRQVPVSGRAATDGMMPRPGVQPFAADPDPE
jgi:excisionase family DNA binding protein